MIRVVYLSDPGFPATDQHPDAKRYTVAGYIVDAIGGQPTPDEVAAFLNPSPPTTAEKLAAVGLTKKDIQDAIAK